MVNTISFEHPVPDHAPDLYQSFGDVDSIDGWEALPRAVQQYEADGFLVVRNAIPAELRDAALEELMQMARGVDANCSNVTFEGSFQSILEESGTPVAEMDEHLRQQSLESVDPAIRAAHVRKFMGFTRTHEQLKAVANYRPLRDAVELLAGEPPKLFQSMALIKPPGGREKPWHQDHAYFDLPLETRVCGVWIALGTVTEENGAMFMLRGGHRGGPIVHFRRRDWQICDTDMEGARPIALPMDAGDLVIFDAKIPHGTPTNRTQDQRWALQYHYVGVSAQKIPEEQRLAVFGPEGKDVSC